MAGKRILAKIIDIIILIISSIVSILFGISGSSFDATGITGSPDLIGVYEDLFSGTDMIISGVFSLVVVIVLFAVVPVLCNGSTIGKLAMGIKVVDEDGNNPRFEKHALRSHMIAYSSFQLLGIIVMSASFIAGFLIYFLSRMVITIVLLINCILFLMEEETRIQDRLLGLHSEFTQDNDSSDKDDSLSNFE